MGRFGDVADARWQGAGICAAQGDDVEPLTKREEPADQRRGIAPNTCRW